MAIPHIDFHFLNHVSAGVLVNKSHNTLAALTFVGGKSLHAFQQRFPALEGLNATTLAFEPRDETNDFIALRVADGADYLCMKECLLVNSFAAAVRVNYVVLLCAIQRDTTEGDWRHFLDDTFHPAKSVAGVLTRPAQHANAIITAAQFVSLFLQDSTKETELGDFLKEHPEILYGAFASDQFVYEPYLEWQSATPSHGEKAINPDLLVKRSDGRYDIGDLKLALLDKKRLTKGARRRRRFIDSVAEGVAQLAHYEEYFSYPANHAHALERYTVDVSDPRCTLVIGNLENLRREEIEEARRSLRNLDLLDYDTVAQLFLAAQDRRTPCAKDAIVRVQLGASLIGDVAVALGRSRK